MSADYRSFLAEGLPIGNIGAANRLLDSGVQGSGNKYIFRDDYIEGRAASVFGQSLRNSAKNPFSARKNPYSQLARAQYYPDPNLGDDASDLPLDSDSTAAQMATRITQLTPMDVAMAPALSNPPPNFPAPAGGSSSGWQDVLQSTTKTLATGFATGLSNLIGGRPQTTIVSAPSAGPSVATMAVVAAAVGGGLFLLLRKR